MGISSTSIFEAAAGIKSAQNSIFNASGGIFTTDSSSAAPSLPTLSVGAPLAVYGARRMVSGYNGPLFRLVNATSTPTTMDIFAISASNNAPNISGVVAWLNGVSTATVDIRYDQTGGGNHETSTTAGNRPFFDPNNSIRGIYGITFDGDANSNQRFDIPAAITGSGQSVTLITVSSFTSSNAGMGSASLGAAWNTAGSLSILNGQSTKLSRLQVLTSSTFVAVGTTYKGRSQPQLVMVASGASNMITYQDETTTTLAANNAGTFVGGLTGRVSVPYAYNGEQYATIIYPGQITAGDAALLKTFLYPEYDILTSATAQLVLAGNSIVQGTKATRNINNIRQAEPSFSRRIFVSNNGIFGQVSGTTHTNIALYQAMYNAGLAKNLICVIEPTNDIAAAASGLISGTATTAWVTNILPDIQALQATGFLVLVPTTLPRTWIGSAQDIIDREAERNTYNGLVASNQATYGYTIVDYAAIANMSNPANTTYYNDGTHPTTVGYGQMAPVLTTKVNTLI